MMTINIPLDEIENRALHDLADRECRDRRSQARYIIRHELERIGLLKAENNKTPSERQLTTAGATDEVMSKPKEGLNDHKHTVIAGS